MTKYCPSEKAGVHKGSFAHFTEADGLPNNEVNSVLEDRFGNIWIGCAGGGLVCYNGKAFTIYKAKQGLSDNGIMSVFEDSQGSLWIGTRKGISKIDMESLPQTLTGIKSMRKENAVVFRNYGYEDGFFGIGCNTNSICEDVSGDIWIGSNQRLSVFHLKSIESDTMAPDVQLSGIELFNEQISWNDYEKNRDSNIVLDNGVVVDDLEFDGLSKWYGIPENLSLAHDVNFLTFNFTGITTRSAASVRYKYILDGLDRTWSSVTDRTGASYGNLPFGTYTFRVKAMNGDGYWSNELKYMFTIRPPWWRTNWAYLIYSLVFIIGIIAVDRIQTRRVIKKEHEKIKDRELEHAREIEHAYKELHLQNEIVGRQKVELEIQKKRSDDLLRNILPSEVAEELKEKGSAEVKFFDEVTVLFADFMDFTHISEKLSPNELVAEINECFSAFDHITQKYNVEKIKTIGDSYLAAGGLPLPFVDSIGNTVLAGLEMQDFMIRRKQEREKSGLLAFDMRMGIHTGPLVAGIVGVKKFQYDIWGDTVNTAHRMEVHGESRKVNVSQSTYESIKDETGFYFEYRGKIDAKSKGELDMYFVAFQSQ